MRAASAAHEAAARAQLDAAEQELHVALGARVEREVRAGILHVPRAGIEQDRPPADTHEAALGRRRPRAVGLAHAPGEPRGHGELFHADRRRARIRHVQVREEHLPDVRVPFRRHLQRARCQRLLARTIRVHADIIGRARINM